jgi:hypothetical protein
MFLRAKKKYIVFQFTKQFWVISFLMMKQMLYPELYYEKFPITGFSWFENVNTRFTIKFKFKMIIDLILTVELVTLMILQKTPIFKLFFTEIQKFLTIFNLKNFLLSNFEFFLKERTRNWNGNFLRIIWPLAEAI